MSDDLVKPLPEMMRAEAMTDGKGHPVDVADELLIAGADRIEELEAENTRLKVALNYFLLRDYEKPTNWEYGRNQAEELARAALQEGEG